MTIDNIMRKYDMSIDEVLNVRAMYGGTVNIASNEHLADVNRMERPDTPWPKSTRCHVRFKSLTAPDYNRAMTLFLILSNEELSTILGSKSCIGRDSSDFSIVRVRK